MHNAKVCDVRSERERRYETRVSTLAFSPGRRLIGRTSLFGIGGSSHWIIRGAGAASSRTWELRRGRESSRNNSQKIYRENCFVDSEKTFREWVARRCTARLFAARNNRARSTRGKRPRRNSKNKLFEEGCEQILRLNYTRNMITNWKNIWTNSENKA